MNSNSQQPFHVNGPVTSSNKWNMNGRDEGHFQGSFSPLLPLHSGQGDPKKYWNLSTGQSLGPELRCKRKSSLNQQHKHTGLLRE